MKGGGCAAQLRAACQADSLEQVGALNYDLASKSGPNRTMSLIDFEQHLASFMLIRGPSSAPLCAARTPNDTGPSRVTLSLR